MGTCRYPADPLGRGFYALIGVMAVAAAVVALPLGVLSHDICPCQEAQGFSGSG